MKTTLLPDAEFEVMETVWAQGGTVTTPLLMEALGAKRGWKIQTLATLLKRLTERGFLFVSKGEGRELRYRPLVTREMYLAEETRQFIKKVHNDSFSSLLAAMGGKLSERDIEELETLIRSAREEDDR